MITIVLTYRNRDIQIVRRCFESLKRQTTRDFDVIVVDFGSTPQFQNEMTNLVNDYYNFIKLVSCPVVNKQLWNKSRAINIALKICRTSHFFVGDIDMIFKEDFLERIECFAEKSRATYFAVGILGKEESKEDKSFSDYHYLYKTNNEATGMTLYPTEVLKRINGYEEFYHGWGAEDTDAHCRLMNSGYEVKFYDDEVFLLHQWHPRDYRRKYSSEPFHTGLEKVNHRYLLQTRELKFKYGNLKFDHGIIPELQAYALLDKPSLNFVLTNEKREVDAFIFGSLLQLKDCIFHVEFSKSPYSTSYKNYLKYFFKRRQYLNFYSMREINDKILLIIVSSLRNNPYKYCFDRQNDSISLIIQL